jgi:autotransporter-associated beta strand protein
VINLQNSSALGASNSGNTVASGASLQLQNNIAVTEGSFGLAGSGVSSTGAIRNLSGNNTLNSALSLNASTTLGADAGTLAITGDINLGSSQTLTTTGAGTLNLSGALNGASGVTQAGTGTLMLSGSTANSYTGTTAVNNGTLQLNKTAGTNAIGGGALTIGDGIGAANSATVALLASNQIADYAGLVTINSDGRLNLNNQSESINTLAGTGSIAFGSTGYLGVGVNSGSSTFGGSLTGTGVLEKLGSGTLTFNSSFNFSGELRLSSGTVVLAGITATVGVLHITGNTILDFGNSSASTLNATTLIVDAGITLTITNWVNATDYFFAQNFNGAAFNTRGSAPVNQITFTGSSNNDTTWQSYDHQVTPAPEPSTYGALFISLGLGFAAWRRRHSHFAYALPL